MTDAAQAGFAPVANYKVIYVISINDKAHRGLVKIGDASLSTDKPVDQLPPGCSDLNQAARKRVNSYTGTAGIEYTLLYTELAVRTVRCEDGSQRLEAFRDKAVHDVLENSGHHRRKVGTTTGIEWYEVDLQCAKDAIAAVKSHRTNLGGVSGSFQAPIVFRDEQKRAIESTIKRFKSADRYLWNAKMRFGKTLSALEVVKRSGYAKTIIMTHRPVVDDGWFEDFNKIFGADDGYSYGSKGKGDSLAHLLEYADKFIYFASIQDLRGSKRVGGSFDKNEDVFDTVWDLVIVDEAHEGTTTALGDQVVKEVFKEGRGTKLLALSGTAFNIISEYSDEDVYTWDYIMEQEMKSEWDANHFGDHNPYSDLPELRIYTYDLGEVLTNSEYITLDDKAFNFREFFRTWEGDATRDHAAMPDTAEVGDFVHEADVVSLLNLMTMKSDTSAYPFSTDEYRDLFRHTFWLLPGVREALALQRLLQAHPVFGSGAFDIINVAGDGDPDDPSGEALQTVKERIGLAGRGGYTITLSCGKLTTGVTVKEWTGVLMLAGSYSTSASQYLQTIFRVQSPYKDLDGKVKESCYVFDFAPDRTLKMVSRAASISARAGQGRSGDKQLLGKFLNYCPVIAVSGSEMHEYSAAKLLGQLKRAYAERVVSNGFADPSLYKDEELLKIDDVDVEDFEDLKAKLGENNSALKPLDGVTLNNQGLTDEEYERLSDLKGKKKTKKPLTEEEQAALDALKRAKEQRRNALALLTQVSIRMPLLIYGADVDYEDEIALREFVDLVDDRSWEEFMPKGVTKRVFRKFMKYYDEDVFVEAGRHIRNQARYADTLAPTERVERIAELFSHFRNPDKETVLTPWRVVNMHMSSCLGGWCFFGKDFAEPLDGGPRFVDCGDVTASVFGEERGRVLEINSKTGLYPLYVAYSLFRQRCGDPGSKSLDWQRMLWLDVVRNNVYVICKTPMAKAITKRTLVGYMDAEVNTRYFEDLVGHMADKRKQFIKKVSKPSYWKKAGTQMEWSAIVGNPPYQQTDGGHGNSAKPVYHEFVQTAIDMSPEYVSMVTPSRWFVGGKGLDEFRARMLADHRMRSIVDFPKLYEPFPNVKIRGGISYFLWDREHDGPCAFQTIMDGRPVGETVERYLDENDVLIRWNDAIPILAKVRAQTHETLDARVSARKPFGFPTNFHGKKEKDGLTDPIKLYGSQKISWIERSAIEQNPEWVSDWKVLMTRAQGTSAAIEKQFLSRPIVAGPGTACSETYLVAGRFAIESEAESYASYLRTRFVRFLVSLRKSTQDAARDVYGYVPEQTYDHEWTDQELYGIYGITPEESAFIESIINPLD